MKKQRSIQEVKDILHTGYKMSSVDTGLGGTLDLKRAAAGGTTPDVTGGCVSARSAGGESPRQGPSEWEAGPCDGGSRAKVSSAELVGHR